MKQEIKLWLTSLLIKWAINICPKGEFNTNFSIFLLKNIHKLK